VVIPGLVSGELAGAHSVQRYTRQHARQRLLPAFSQLPPMRALRLAPLALYFLPRPIQFLVAQTMWIAQLNRLHCLLSISGRITEYWLCSGLLQRTCWPLEQTPCHSKNCNPGSILPQAACKLHDFAALRMARFDTPSDISSKLGRELCIRQPLF
jgi:hypothetical protein